MIHTWLRRWMRRWSPEVRSSRPVLSRQPRCRLFVDMLEDRVVPATIEVLGLGDAAATALTDLGNGTFTAADLRSAVVNATTTGDASNTIVFDPSLTGTLTLSIVGDSSAGRAALLVNSNLTIDGDNGNDGITITQNAATVSNVPPGMRLFTVNSGKSLTLNALTLSGGRAQGGNGGIDSYYGAGGAAGMGGAIFNRGTLTIQNSTLVNNTAQGGAGSLGEGEMGYSRGAGGGGLARNGFAPDGFTPGAGGGPNGGSPGENNVFSITPAGNGGFGGGGGGDESSSLFDTKGGNGGFGGGGGSGTGGIFFTDSDGGAGGFGGGGGAGWTGGAGGFGGGAAKSSGGGGGAGMGGAVFNLGGTVTINDSTLTGNVAKGGAGASAGNGQGLGGGVFNLNGTLTIRNSTLSLNSAKNPNSTVIANGGRDVFNLGDGAAAITTLTGNASKATATINNSILGESNTDAQDFTGLARNTGSNSATGTRNLIRSSSHTFTNTIAGDPALGALTDNGGPTKTMFPASNSPVINAGSNSGVASADQRGVTRILNGTVDIGAVEVDYIAPDTSFTNTPADLTNDNTPTFEFTGDDGTGVGLSHFLVAIDSGSYTTQSSPFTTGTLSDGYHWFIVRAVDNNGNVDGSPAMYLFRVDTVAPDTTLLTTPGSLIGNATPTFTFTGDDDNGRSPDHFEVQIDGGGFTTQSSPFTTPTLSDGNHTVEVRAVDAAGNFDPTPASFTFKVDTTAPDTSFTDTPADPTSTNTPTFTFTGTDAGSGVSRYEVQIDGGGFTTQSSPFTTPTLSDGSHTVEVRAVDNVGNVDPTPASYVFDVDTQAPTVSISAPSAASVPGGTVTFTITYTDANFNASTLAAGDITLNKTGTASGTVSVSGSGSTRTVTISNITGLGTLGISIAAGTATDRLGQAAAAAGPSAAVFVRPSPKFDMKASVSSQAPEGWNKVWQGTKYSAATGYGWSKTSSVGGGTGGKVPAGDDTGVLGDYAYGVTTATFQVFIGANQSATVNISSYATAAQGKPGVAVKIGNGPTSTLADNGVLTVTGTAGADGILNITFNRRTGAAMWLVSAIEVTPGLVH